MKDDKFVVQVGENVSPVLEDIYQKTTTPANEYQMH